MPHLASVVPRRAITGGRVTVMGDALFGHQASLPAVVLKDKKARVVFASPSRIAFLVPEGVGDGGAVDVHVDTAPGATVSLTVAVPIATDLHHVDSPAIDRQGHLYLTYSGTRGQRAPVSMFRVGPGGNPEHFSSSIAHPTSLACDAQGRLYASDRFEGIVYRVHEDGSAETFASDVGVPCGLAFGPDGELYVGDRTGTIFKVDPRGHARAFATLPASVAAFHLAAGAQGIFVTAP
ncbi:MAG: gluconolaconase, partial [Acidobacteriaceae bacterium]|nr:gluconolaconase [Acidobacteriaceae bacterium]